MSHSNVRGCDSALSLLTKPYFFLRSSVDSNIGDVSTIFLFRIIIILQKRNKICIHVNTEDRLGGGGGGGEEREQELGEKGGKEGGGGGGERGSKNWGRRGEKKVGGREGAKIWGGEGKREGGGGLMTT